MALILNIESSTEVCSVSVSRDGEILQIIENVSGQNHSKLMTVFIEKVFQNADLSINELDAVAVSGGPGSYTGLRIGVAASKGICYALNIPLIAISSLESMTHHVLSNLNLYNLPSGPMLFCPMIDARRMEVYTAFYNEKSELIRQIQADIIEPDSYQSYLEQSKVVFFGNGAEKCKRILIHPNSIFLDQIRTSAFFMADLSEKAFREKKFVDVAYYEPFYLKDFVATIPTKNIFGGEKGR